MKRYTNQSIDIAPELGASFVERWYSQARRLASAPAIGRTSMQETVIGLETRFDVEVASGFSEALRGKVATHYEFDVDEVGHILAPDGEQLEIMMLRARQEAYELATKDPRMQFVVDRFETEVNELHEQQRMVQGESEHNTIITFSPYTQELIGQPDLLKAGYQRPELLRSMVRVSHWDGRKMHIYTRSLDNSTLELLGLTAGDALGHTFASNGSLGMLGERIHKSVSKDEVEGMLKIICSRFDKHLFARTGKYSEQGAYAPDNKDLLAFVQAYPNVLANIKAEARALAKTAKTYEEFEELFNGCLYKHLALYEKLLAGEGLSSESISDQASGAGESAAEAGTTYSLCGTVVSGTAGLNTLGMLTGFESVGLAVRLKEIEKLQSEKRDGICVTCGSSGSVYGCGLCSRCNKVWCDEYASTGRGLSVEQVGKIVNKKSSSAKLEAKAQRRAEKAETESIRRARKILNDDPKRTQRWEFFRRNE